MTFNIIDKSEENTNDDSSLLDRLIQLNKEYTEKVTSEEEINELIERINNRLKERAKEGYDYLNIVFEKIKDDNKFFGNTKKDSFKYYYTNLNTKLQIGVKLERYYTNNKLTVSYIDLETDGFKISWPNEYTKL